jgi:phospholipid transport system substrate-binding protein
MGRWSFRPRWLCRWFLLVTLALAPSSPSLAAESQKRSEKPDDAPNAAAPALTPLDLVQSSLARTRAILRGPAAPAADDQDDRRREVRHVARELFAFDTMARRVLGPQWATLPAASQQEFLRLFTDMIEQVYGLAMERYAGEHVVFLGEKVSRTHAEVRSRLTTRGTVVSIDYRMLEHGSRWAVYDAVVDDMSVVANYRNQFESIIRTSSFAQLLDRMQRFSRAQARRPGDPEAEEQKVLVLAFLFGSAATRK